ncbi:MAG: AAA family ATPase [Gloeobacterales cyanobacterium]
MSRITLYQIPSSETEYLLQDLSQPYYWNPAHTHLQRWELGYVPTEIEVTSDPLLVTQHLLGDVVLDGLLVDGFSSKLGYQIINAHRERRDQSLFILGDRFDCPHDLFPFVDIKTWPLPNTLEVADFLHERDAYSDAVHRAAVGLYKGELSNVLEMYGALTDEAIAQAIADYKIKKLQGRGITVVPKPDCSAAGMDILDGIIEEIQDLMKPEAFEAGVQFPKGTILIGPPGTGKSLFAKSIASRLGLPLLCADWTGLISPVPGESESNLQLLLQSAVASAPCVLMWDDYDKAFASADPD